jgi:23S rRNA pseudouridine1911/1915/1917 synthase
LAWGDFKEDAGTINGHIGRSLRDRKVQAIYPDGSQGKHATTHWRVLERFHFATLIECKLETGRTHQIRAHMQHIGHPLFSDTTYGGDRIIKGSSLPRFSSFIENSFQVMNRQALHAKTLGLIHPETKEYISFESELAPDFAAVLQRFRDYTQNK